MRHPRVGRSAERVLLELRSGAKTVEELAAALAVTPNAVRTQLASLEAVGSVHPISRRRTSSKPAAVYGITPRGQEAFAAAYSPVLRELMKTAERTLPPRQFDALVNETGKQMAAAVGPAPRTTDRRVRQLVATLNALGGAATSRRTGRGFVIESSGCPISAVTADVSAACRILRAMVTAYVERPTTICCVADGRHPRCCFRIDS